MTRKRISKRNAKHSKTYKGGVLTYDTATDTYQTLIAKMNNKLNLNQRSEGSGIIYGNGWLEYLIKMAKNLKTRPEFKKYKENIARISLFIENVTEVQTNYTELVKAFKQNDPEITFQIILGCIQVLYINMCDLLSYLPVDVYTVYQGYLIDKTELFATEIETLKNIEHIKNRTVESSTSYEPIKSYEPIIIGNNIALYEFWKKHKNERSISIENEDIGTFVTCKNWRRNMIKTADKIEFRPYYKDKDACKNAKEKREAHKIANVEQPELQEA